MHSEVQIVRGIRDDGSDQRLERGGERLDESFSAAAFAVPAQGRISSPVRLRWGWDVLYVREIAPAVELSYEEAAPKLRERLYSEESVRRTLFMRWAAPFGEDLDIDVHPERLPSEDDPLELAGKSPG